MYSAHKSTIRVKLSADSLSLFHLGLAKAVQMGLKYPFPKQHTCIMQVQVGCWFLFTWGPLQIRFSNCMMAGFRERAFPPNQVKHIDFWNLAFLVIWQHFHPTTSAQAVAKLHPLLRCSDIHPDT